MVESASGIEDKSVGRVSSFIKRLKSPLHTSANSKSKRSKSALGRIFGSKKKPGTNDDEKSVSFHLKDVGLPDEDFESMENTSFSYHHKEDSNAKTCIDEEKKLGDLLQVSQEVVTNENISNEIKEGMKKVDEGVDKVVQAIEFTITTNKKPVDDVQQLTQQEVNVSSIVERLQEVAINAPSSIEQLTREVEDNLENIEPSLVEHEGTSNDEEIKEEMKTEDSCVSSLAQGLEKICAPWNTN